MSEKYKCKDCNHIGYPVWVHNDDKCGKCYSGDIVVVKEKSEKTIHLNISTS